jgi:hypothetical protein
MKGINKITHSRAPSLYDYPTSKKNYGCGGRPFKGGKSKSKSAKKQRSRKMKGGGTGYGFSPKVGVGYKHVVPIREYKNCGFNPPSKLGAGIPYVGTSSIQKGAGSSLSLQPASIKDIASNNNISVDSYNNTDTARYGYVSPDDNASFAGYRPNTVSLSKPKNCKLTGGGKKVKGMGKNLLKKWISEFKKVSKKTLKKHKKKRHGKNRHSKKRSKQTGRGKSRGKSRHNKNRHSKKHHMRGGYSQYQSNVPLTNSLRTAVGSAGGKWSGQLASPPTFSKMNNCVDNYNHYTKKGSPSPILDKSN